MGRPYRERGRKSLKRINPDRRYILVVLLAMIAGVVTFLFVVDHAASQELEFSQHTAAREGFSISPTGSDIIDASGTALETGSSPRAEATLSNDQNHDGNIDGMDDPLVVLLWSLVILGPCFALLMSLKGGLLLGLREPLILVGSGYYPALECPG